MSENDGSHLILMLAFVAQTLLPSLLQMPFDSCPELLVHESCLTDQCNSNCATMIFQWSHQKLLMIEWQQPSSKNFWMCFLCNQIFWDPCGQAEHVCQPSGVTRICWSLNQRGLPLLLVLGAGWFPTECLTNRESSQ